MINFGFERILIFAPKRVLSSWQKQFREHAGDAILPIVPPERYSVPRRVEFIKDWIKEYDPPYAVALNYEAVATKSAMRSFLRAHDWDLLVLDESHRIKAPGGATSKWVATLASKIPYKLALTGTPMPHSPLDVYAQYRVIDPEIFGTNYAVFKARYAVMHPEYKSMPVQFLNQDELHEKFYLIAHRIETADVIDLPERIEIPIEVELSEDAFQHYVDLETEFYTWVEQVDEEVSIPNALVKLLRLQQLTGGNLVTDDGNTHRVDQSKADALADLLEDLPTTEPVVVFAQFHADLDAIREVADRRKRRYGEISGRVDESDYDAWARGDIDLIGVQIQAGGEGLNELVRARYCVYWSTGFSLGRFNQSRARLLRPGQKRNVVEYHLIARGTVDERVAEALRKKQEVVSYVLDARR